MIGICEHARPNFGFQKSQFIPSNATTCTLFGLLSKHPDNLFNYE